MKKEVRYEVTYPMYSDNVNCFIMVQAIPEWCTSCNGTGGRSRYDVEGYNIDEMLSLDDENEGSFREDYFSGRTDVVCDSCNGDKFHTVPCWDECSDEHKALIEASGKEWQDYWRWKADDEATRRAENAF
jgi:hypothetical protein